jgi:hypothetical protein
MESFPPADTNCARIERLPTGDQDNTFFLDKQISIAEQLRDKSYKLNLPWCSKSNVTLSYNLYVLKKSIDWCGGLGLSARTPRANNSKNRIVRNKEGYHIARGKCFRVSLKSLAIGR